MTALDPIELQKPQQTKPSARRAIMAPTEAISPAYEIAEKKRQLKAVLADVRDRLITEREWA